MRDLLSKAEQHLLDAPLSGIGLEIGAGLGVLSATVADSHRVCGVLAVEVCPNFVDLVIPRVAKAVLEEQARKVVPTLGSFDDLELEDRSVDFVVEIDSLHHAEDLDAVLDECARVLKPGGRMLCFDRTQPDDMPDWLREQMLDRQYSERWILENGYPPGVDMTRRQNGEHEIRMGEWNAAFMRAGLRLARVVRFVPAVTLKMAAKSAISYLPRSLGARLIAMPEPREYLPAWFRTRLRPGRAAGSVVIGPKLTTGMLAYR
jgi:SAM-dependent methyltransferase